jgi:hypothetical protein
VDRLNGYLDLVAARNRRCLTEINERRRHNLDQRPFNVKAARAGFVTGDKLDVAEAQYIKSTAWD